MARKGIPQIKIPIRPNELTIEKVEPYLPTIFSQFEKNACDIRDDYDKYCLDHDILGKTRPYDDTEINNIVLIPNLKSIIDWKTGYVFGNPIKYAQNESSFTDDIKYLNKYVRNACQRTVDKNVGTWAYATGLGYYFIEPKSHKVDIENEAPYELYAMNSDACTKVYSAFNGNKALFDIIFTKYEERNSTVAQTVRVMDIYFPNALYTYEKRVGDWQRTRIASRGMTKPLPLVEKRLNEDAIGIVAMGESMQNAIDKLISNGLDNVEEVVNEIFVYSNTGIGDTPEKASENHRKMKKGGAIAIRDPKDGKSKAGVTTLTPSLKLDEITQIYTLVNQAFHSAIGVPMEMSNTNSGNTTKQGSEVANGYDNAYNRALDDINTFMRADTELLQKIMWICKNTDNNKIDELSSSDIEIKYSLNLTDNIMSKAQAFGTLIQYMPPSMALQKVRLSNDSEAEGKQIEDSDVYKAFIANINKKSQNNSENPNPQSNGDRNLE